jgi:hypothetical protein
VSLAGLFLMSAEWQFGLSLLVFLGSTAKNGTPARAALYSMNCLSCTNAHGEWSQRCASLTVAFFLLPLSSSTAMAEEMPLAYAPLSGNA